MANVGSLLQDDVGALRRRMEAQAAALQRLPMSLPTLLMHVGLAQAVTRNSHILARVRRGSGLARGSGNIGHGRRRSAPLLTGLGARLVGDGATQQAFAHTLETSPISYASSLGASEPFSDDGSVVGAWPSSVCARFPKQRHVAVMSRTALPLLPKRARRLAQLCNARHLMGASGARFKLHDLVLYRDAKRESETSHGRLLFLRGFFQSWLIVVAQRKRRLEHTMHQNSLVQKFRSRGTRAAFAAWKEAAAQASKLKNLLRFQFANASQTSFDRWREFVREQHAERQTVLRGFLFKMQNRAVVNCFNNLATNVKQNGIMRRFLLRMQQRNVVLTFDAWATLVERNRAVRVWKISKWWSKLHALWHAVHLRKQALINKMLLRLKHAVVVRTFAAFRHFLFMSQQARRIAAAFRGHMARSRYRAVCEGERKIEGIRAADENTYTEAVLKEGRRVLQVFLMTPAGINAVAAAAVKLKSAEAKKAVGQKKGRGSRAVMENARSVFELYLAADIVGPGEGLLGLERGKLQILLDGSMGSRVSSDVVDKALSLVHHGTNWRLNKGGISSDEFVRIAAFVESEMPRLRKFLRLFQTSKSLCVGEKSRMRRAITQQMELAAGRKARAQFRKEKPCAQECPRCGKNFRFIFDRNNHFHNSCPSPEPTVMYVESVGIVDKHKLGDIRQFQLRKLTRLFLKTKQRRNTELSSAYAALDLHSQRTSPAANPTN